MKIEYVYSSDEWSNEHDYRQFFEVYVNGTQLISVFDNEPEDSNLSRSFADIYNIPQLVNTVIEAVKRGEEIEIESKESDE